MYIMIILLMFISMNIEHQSLWTQVQSFLVLLNLVMNFLKNNKLCTNSHVLYIKQNWGSKFYRFKTKFPCTLVLSFKTKSLHRNLDDKKWDKVSGWNHNFCSLLNRNLPHKKYGNSNIYRSDFLTYCPVSMSTTWTLTMGCNMQRSGLRLSARWTVTERT